MNFGLPFLKKSNVKSSESHIKIYIVKSYFYWVKDVESSNILEHISKMYNLQVLDLTGNNLQILPREVFSRHRLLNLQKLKLANCNIGNFSYYPLSYHVKFSFIIADTFLDFPFLSANI